MLTIAQGHRHGNSQGSYSRECYVLLTEILATYDSTDKKVQLLRLTFIDIN